MTAMSSGRSHGPLRPARSSWPGRKLGPIASSAGSTHRAWLMPLRAAYLESNFTLGDLSLDLRFAKSKLSEVLRGMGHYPRWEIIFGLAKALQVPSGPLYGLWRQAACEAHKSPHWIKSCTDPSVACAVPPLDHRAFRELVEERYSLYAHVFLCDEDRDAALSVTFDILWLSWEKALASPKIHSYAWEILRGNVMARTPHVDGWPELDKAAFDTVALQTSTSDTDRLKQLEESLRLFKTMSRLPDRQLDVMVLRRMYRMTPEDTSSLLGISLAAVQSDERHARYALESVLCPPPESEGNNS